MIKRKGLLDSIANVNRFILSIGSILCVSAINGCVSVLVIPI